MKKSYLHLVGGVLLCLTMMFTSCGNADNALEEIINGGGNTAPQGTPLTLEAKTAGTIVVKNPQTGMKYSLNGGAKTAVTSDAITVAVGDKVQFYGSRITTYYSEDGDPSNDTEITGGTAECSIYGNIMSLLNETDFATATALTSPHTFHSLFLDNTNLTDASDLQLPATTLAENCYYQMFKGCTNLASAPALPATDLKDCCYFAMFYNTGLTTPPALPATDLKDGCYMNMFGSCASLTETPHLAATTLASSCYNGMFENCTALKKAYVKAAYSNSDTGDLIYCCYAMFNGCTDATTSTFYSDNAADYISAFGTTLGSWQTAAYK